jgi:hypothetical protein
MARILSDDDVILILQHLHGIAQQRGLDTMQPPKIPNEYPHHPPDGENVTIGGSLDQIVTAIRSRD